MGNHFRTVKRIRQISLFDPNALSNIPGSPATSTVPNLAVPTISSESLPPSPFLDSSGFPTVDSNIPSTTTDLNNSLITTTSAPSTNTSQIASTSSPISTLAATSNTIASLSSTGSVQATTSPSYVTHMQPAVLAGLLAAIGVIVIIAILVITVLFCRKRRRRDGRELIEKPRPSFVFSNEKVKGKMKSKSAHILGEEVPRTKQGHILGQDVPEKGLLVSEMINPFPASASYPSHHMAASRTGSSANEVLSAFNFDFSGQEQRMSYRTVDRDSTTIPSIFEQYNHQTPVSLFNVRPMSPQDPLAATMLQGRNSSVPVLSSTHNVLVDGTGRKAPSRHSIHDPAALHARKNSLRSYTPVGFESKDINRLPLPNKDKPFQDASIYIDEDTPSTSTSHLGAEMPVENKPVPSRMTKRSTLSASPTPTNPLPPIPPATLPPTIMNKKVPTDFLGRIPGPPPIPQTSSRPRIWDRRRSRGSASLSGSEKSREKQKGGRRSRSRSLSRGKIWTAWYGGDSDDEETSSV